MLLTFEQFKEQTDPNAVPQVFRTKELNDILAVWIFFERYLKENGGHNLIEPLYLKKFEVGVRSRDYSEAEISELFRIFEETGE